MDIKKEMDLTILFIAHNLAVVKYFSDRIGVMYFGNMVELADADELYDAFCNSTARSIKRKE